MANNVGNVRRVNKRFVERSSSTVNHTLTQAITSLVLHNVTERETIVRAILDMEVSSVNGGTFGTWSCELNVEPSGTSVHAPSSTQSLGNSIPKEVMWQKVGEFPAADMHNHFLIDLKSMRKLTGGDEVVFRTVATNAASIEIVGTITLFLKQT